MNFFFYGTLIDSDVRDLVLRRRADTYAVVPATLRCHRRVFVRGRTYPIVIPRFYDAVPGILVTGLDADAANRLVAFEGPEYRLTTFEVFPEGGEPVLARVFVANAGAKPTLKPWDFDDWAEKYREAYLRELRTALAS